MNVTSENTTERLDLIDKLKSFLATAPDGQEEPVKQHEILSGESVSCVKWNDSFYISGTDIVRCLIFRFQAFGRPIQHLKKFEEGIFSDLRNLKPGTDAILEEPKSAFLDLLFQNNCIRTQKKQKVFFWYSVPHDRLFLDALERDLKREKMGIEPTSVAMAHPALAISLDTTQAMFDNFRKSVLSELNLGPYYHQANSPASSVCADDDMKSVNTSSPAPSETTANNGKLGLDTKLSHRAETQKSVFPTSTIFGQFSLFEGSPTYKQRRRRVTLKSQQKKQQQITNQPEKGSTSSNSNSRESSTNGESSVTWNNSFDNYTDDEIHTTRHFHCPLPACDKVFKRLEHMKRHLRTHTMERPYMCDLCGKRFSRSDNLSQHKKTHDRRKLKKIPSSNSSGVKKGAGGDSKESSSGSTKSANSVSGYLSKSINTSFPARQRPLGTRQNRSSDPTYSQNTTRQSTLSPSTRTTGRALNRSRRLRRNIQLRQRQRLSRSAGDDVEVMYDTANWSDHHDSSELLKVNPDYEEEVKPELSISTASSSTASSSTASSCDTSPTCTRLPTIKIEDVDTYYDNQPQQQIEDTAMFMVEEYMPQQQQQNQHGWEDESASDWQRRVDWNQYSPKATADDVEHDAEDFNTAYSSNQYYLHQPYSHYDVSCLTSPTMISSFLFDASNTSTSNSTATTVASSPTMRPSEYHPPHYFSDESPTITPSDALLQRY